jgi:hypothetical protein
MPTFLQDSKLWTLALSLEKRIATIEGVISRKSMMAIEDFSSRGTMVVIISEVDDGRVHIINTLPVETSEELNELIDSISKNYFVAKDTAIVDAPRFRRNNVPERKVD